MKKIWIVGSSGHVGSALNKILNAWEYEIIMTDKDEVDIADEKQVGVRNRRHLGLCVSKPLRSAAESADG